jgi:hypothetical protein
MKSLATGLVAAALCAASAFWEAGYVDAATPAEAFPPADQLAAACRKAKADFRPLTEADLQDAKAELIDAMARLDRRLDAAGENGAAWRKYLQWPRLRAQLQQGKTPDLEVLDAVYTRYTAGYDGLELVWFLDLREALRRYRDMARSAGDPQLRTRYDQLLDFLAAHLEAYAARPTAEDALRIGQAICQLEDARQAPALVRAIRHHFLRPNLFLEVSADVVAAGIATPIDETAPVHEVILGTDVYGTGHTTGRVRAELAADSGRAVIDAVFLGNVKTRNIGYHGPVRIYSRGSTRLDARKRFWIDTTGLASLPTVSSAATRTKITGIRSRKGRRLVERFAWRRTFKQKGQAECIASRRAEKRVNGQIDRQAAETIGRANRAFVDKFRKPLLQRKLFPQQLRFTTTREALRVVSLRADQYQLAAPTAPPKLFPQADLALALHESMINNVAAGALAGRTLREKALEATLIDLLGELPEQLKADEDRQPWAVSFSPIYPITQYRPPISVAFGQNGFRVTVRGRRFYKGEESYPGMDVSADYKIERTQQGFAAIRQGDLQILPPDFASGRTRKLSPREVVIRTLLHRRFEKIFKQEMLGEGFVLPGKWQKMGKMRPVQLACQDGWLTVAWKRAPAEQTLAKTVADRPPSASKQP